MRLVRAFCFTSLPRIANLKLLLCTGAYIDINCPAVSALQWHPFTVNPPPYSCSSPFCCFSAVRPSGEQLPSNTSFRSSFSHRYLRILTLILCPSPSRSSFGEPAASTHAVTVASGCARWLDGAVAKGLHRALEHVSSGGICRSRWHCCRRLECRKPASDNLWLIFYYFKNGSHALPVTPRFVSQASEYRSKLTYLVHSARLL